MILKVSIHIHSKFSAGGVSRIKNSQKMSKSTFKKVKIAHTCAYVVGERGDYPPP